ncbi:hypothetical protein ACT691_00750 [Vibrio metschnikovii]
MSFVRCRFFLSIAYQDNALLAQEQPMNVWLSHRDQFDKEWVKRGIFAILTPTSVGRFSGGYRLYSPILN